MVSFVEKLWGQCHRPMTLMASGGHYRINQGPEVKLTYGFSEIIAMCVVYLAAVLTAV